MNRTKNKPSCSEETVRGSRVKSLWRQYWRRKKVYGGKICETDTSRFL